MGSIRTKKAVEKEKRKQGKKGVTSGFEWIQFSPISLLFTIIGLCGVGYITWKYYGSDSYGDYGLVLLLLGIISISCILFMNSRNSLKFNERFDFSDVRSLLEFATWVLLLILSIEISIWVIQYLSKYMSVRYALTPTDLMFYYVSAAIIEELFFRMVLCGFLRVYTKVHPVLIALFCSIPFAMVHWESYAGDPIMLFTMYIGGVLFSLYYLYTKDITITMTAHAIINLIMVGTLIMQMGG